ncbi:prisilkin-39 [Drosophila busckii]|uniref:prisilkin-39 n=1 Tax=Drosophila busckii TaxID=30019 RepID=UPI00083EFECB|nr:prisilkin-39 [Drosophila busckii]
MKVTAWMFLTLLLGSYLHLGSALFLKALKAAKGFGYGSSAGYYNGYNSGYRGYSPGYSSGYNYGYAGYGPGYSSRYAPGYNNYGYSSGYNAPRYNYGYNAYAGYSGGYGGGGYSRPSRQRQGRTYSEIARVLKPDKYLGLGNGRYLPHTPYSHLW